MAEKKEFADDPMMYELHEIRDQIHQKIKDLSTKEKVAWIHREAEEFLKSQGYILIPTGKGYSVETKTAKTKA